MRPRNSRRLDELADPFVPQQPRDHGRAERPVRLRRRCEAGRVDAGAGNHHDAVPVDAQPCNEGRVVRVLGQAGGAPAVQRPAKRHAHERAQQPRPQIAGREHVTQPGQRADDRRNAGEPRRSAAVEHRLHRDRMDDVRPLGPIDAHERGKRAQVRQRRDSSPLHGDGQHPHSFGADRIAMGRNRAGNGDGEAGVPRRPRNRHPVGDEEAVVARDEEQFRPPLTGASVFRFGHRGPLARPRPFFSSSIRVSLMS